MIVRKVRPRFRLRLQLAADEILARITERLARPDCPCEAMISDAHRLVELRVRKQDRHFWSPALSVTVSEGDRGAGSVVDGLIGPNPNVWTLFAMLYMGLWTMLMFAGIFGLVQWTLDRWPWGLWVTGALAVALALLYLVSRVGQHLAAPQTAMLRHVLEEALDLPQAERSLTDDDPYHGRAAASG
jgi:hypothetical protein